MILRTKEEEIMTPFGDHFKQKKNPFLIHKAQKNSNDKKYLSIAVLKTKKLMTKRKKWNA